MLSEDRENARDAARRRTASSHSELSLESLLFLALLFHAVAIYSYVVWRASNASGFFSEPPPVVLVHARNVKLIDLGPRFGHPGTTPTHGHRSSAPPRGAAGAHGTRSAQAAARHSPVTSPPHTVARAPAPRNVRSVASAPVDVPVPPPILHRSSTSGRPVEDVPGGASAQSAPGTQGPSQGGGSSSGTGQGTAGSGNGTGGGGNGSGSSGISVGSQTLSVAWHYRSIGLTQHEVDGGGSSPQNWPDFCISAGLSLANLLSRPHISPLLIKSSLHYVVYSQQDLAVLLRISGRVFLRVRISENGRPSVTIVASSGNPVIDRTAALIVSNTRWLPALRKGLPAAETISFPVDLENAAPSTSSESSPPGG